MINSIFSSSVSEEGKYLIKFFNGEISKNNMYM